MRILILTMDDPVQTNTFIRQIIEARSNDIIGVALTSRDRLAIGKNRSRTKYLLSLLFIMGIFGFIKNSIITLLHKLKKVLSGKGVCKDPSILSFAKAKSIPTLICDSPNEELFLKRVKEMNPDIIISQTQHIIKKELLRIPKIGVINRHNALLPKNRGRLTPFWVLYKKEEETGVSIHFVTEKLDAGRIIVQKRFRVSSSETFMSLVKKNYQLAPIAMLEALDILEKGVTDFMPNLDDEASYNTIPTLKEAWQYRLAKLKGNINY